MDKIGYLRQYIECKKCGKISFYDFKGDVTVLHMSCRHDYKKMRKISPKKAAYLYLIGK